MGVFRPFGPRLQGQVRFYFAQANRRYSSGSPTYEHLLVSTPKPGVGMSTGVTYLVLN